jgi:GTP-binding protein
MFVDHARVYVLSGGGGDGCLSFRREKFVPRGGPDGGDGGDGGSVILKVDPSLSTLNPFRFRQHLRAERGQHGRGKDQHGRAGKDLVVMVPPGTEIFDEKGDRLVDLVDPGATWTAAKGGRGGRGNARFATSTNQAPRRRERGQAGEERTLTLELRLLADVGLVGEPNAGKSTLISRISSARPKIADYPFTTLTPHLGVVDAGGFESFVLADIPGLIEGAHHGAGLGTRFLRHVERTSLLIHLVDISRAEGEDPLESLRIIEGELEAVEADLMSRPRIVVATKIDLVPGIEGAEAALKRLRAECRKAGTPFLAISAVSGEGVTALVTEIARTLREIRPLREQRGSRHRPSRGQKLAGEGA